MRTHTRNRTAGFTLVELLVAMALIVLIMSILASAFGESATVFREAKAIGDMQEKLRTAVVSLRNDLLQRHFDGSRKLGRDFVNGTRPTEGFVRIFQAAPPTNEGIDGDLIPSYRAVDQVLHLTTMTVGDRRENYWTALAPSGGIVAGPPPRDRSQPLWSEGPPDYQTAGYFNSQRSEVMWYLQPMIDPGTGLAMFAGTPPAPLTPLYTLNRRQKLVVTSNNGQLNNPQGGPTYRLPANLLGQFPEVACIVDPNPANAGYLYFPNMVDLTNPTMRTLTTPPAPLPINMMGEDRVISDVVSFEIRIITPGTTAFRDVWTATGNTSGTYDTNTWPTPITLTGIQIVIRVWDYKTEQTRQITVVQDM